MRLALVVEYEGTRFHGFQFQVNACAIQEEIEEAIKGVTGERVRAKGAGRTDAGVHAIGQVVAFDTASHLTPETFVKALNAHLPEDIAVRAAYRVRGDFDPRRHASSRKYRYTILNRETPAPLLRRTTWRTGETLDIRKMDEASHAFVGVHDFARFAAAPEHPGSSTIRRVLEARVAKDGEIVTIDIEGSSFLPRQVRRMAGALVDVGRSELTAKGLKAMIDGQDSDRVAHSLPPEGLCLMAVTYENFPPVSEDDNDIEH